MKLSAAYTYWNSNKWIKWSALSVLIFLGTGTLLSISLGAVLMVLLFGIPSVLTLLSRKQGAFVEAIVDSIYLSLLIVHVYLIYTPINALPICGAMIIVGSRASIHTFALRKYSDLHTTFIYMFPVLCGIALTFKLIPTYSFPVPSDLELSAIGIVLCVMAAIFHFISNKGYLVIIDQIEKSEASLNARSQQILELNQILNHNLRTPLATAVGQLEIAQFKSQGDEHISKAIVALHEVISQTESVNNAKKVFATSTNAIELLEKWKVVYGHSKVELRFQPEMRSFMCNEQNAIALAVSLDIFTHNSKEAGASKIIIEGQLIEGKFQVKHYDNGPGVSSETLVMFGSPMNSGKEDGAGLGTYLAQRLLASAGAAVQFSNRQEKSGFQVAMEF